MPSTPTRSSRVRSPTPNRSRPKPGSATCPTWRPGISRKKRGKGFSYEKPDGTVITDPEERARIAAIAIPPAWTDVWICPQKNGHILATGRDARGRKQYRYHPRWREVRDADKFGQLAEFGEMLPDVRKAVDADLRRRGLPREKVLALVVKLLDETLIRIGNEAYAAENESYGLTTLKPDHVEVVGDALLFDFVGKSGLEHAVFLEDKQLARIVHQCHELGGQDLFGYQASGRGRRRHLERRERLPRRARRARRHGQDLPHLGRHHHRGGDPRPRPAARFRAAGRAGGPGCRTTSPPRCWATPERCAAPATCTPWCRRPTASGELPKVWKRSRAGGELDRGERTVLKLLSG